MNKELKRKTFSNAIIVERLNRFTKEEKKIIISDLLMGKSERELGEELGISHSTIHDWKTGRQDNTGEGIHVSLALIIRRLEGFMPLNSDDYVSLHKIIKIVEDKLK